MLKVPQIYHPFITMLQETTEWGRVGRREREREREGEIERNGGRNRNRERERDRESEGGR